MSVACIEAVPYRFDNQATAALITPHFEYLVLAQQAASSIRACVCFWVEGDLASPIFTPLERRNLLEDTDRPALAAPASSALHRRRVHYSALDLTAAITWLRSGSRGNSCNRGDSSAYARGGNRERGFGGGTQTAASAVLGADGVVSWTWRYKERAWVGVRSRKETRALEGVPSWRPQFGPGLEMGLRTENGSALSVAVNGGGRWQILPAEDVVPLVMQFKSRAGEESVGPRVSGIRGEFLASTHRIFQSSASFNSTVTCLHGLGELDVVEAKMATSDVIAMASLCVVGRIVGGGKDSNAWSGEGFPAARDTALGNNAKKAPMKRKAFLL
uniref:Uncharacterized protein n=1 Tax=Mycena chlorophos TaxID=658473 RepID=A0ABQ0KXX3_MYCCL|nr:predicted protein [Mycena chlorophos]